MKEKKDETMLKVTMFVKGDNRIEFWPVKDVPSYTHRVIVNGEKAGYLHHENKPNLKTAKFFLAKAARNSTAWEPEDAGAGCPMEGGRDLLGD